MTTNKNNKVIAASVIGAIVVIALVIVGIISMMVNNVTERNNLKSASLDEMLKRVDITTATPVKGSISLDDASLYDELPDIEKYPLAVKGEGDIDIEIFTSGEKAGKDYNSWLIECAKDFNQSDITVAGNQTVSISVRAVSSGLAADYIISGRYYPDLYTPSNQLFGDYAVAQGGSLELYNSRLIGNTAGILVKKNSEYKDIKSIVEAVIDGKLNIGYTNPQTSATGLNMMLQILKIYDSENILSDTASKAFSDFNSNIPFVAYTTQQMADNASSGVLDGMVSEYQAYINDSNLTSMYDFIPFGVRHDNPLYIVNKSDKSSAELEAIEAVNNYLKDDNAQNIASKDGFNANDDYKSDFSVSGAEVTQALTAYKTLKDSGKDIIAVFVADCSGSMSGEPMAQLKESLSNGMRYINDNNYVGLVSYSNDVTIELPVNPFDLNQKSYFQGAVNNLNASGGTSSYEAILTAVQMVQDEQAKHPDAKTMIFLLSDGMANGYYRIDDIEHIVRDSGIPVYTIGYNLSKSEETDELSRLSAINEAGAINADSDDIIYQIKSLFNSQL